MKLYPTVEKYVQMMTGVDSSEEAKRDMGEIFRLFDKFKRYNPRIRGHLNSRRAAVSSWDFDVQAYDKADEQRASETLLRLKSALRITIKQSIKQATYGCFALSIEWDAATQTPVLKPVKQDTISPAGDNTAYLRNGNNSRVIGEDVNYIAGSDNEMPGGQLGSIGLFEIIRHEMLYEWRNYNMKLKGILHGIDKGGSEDERAVLKQALETAAKDNYMITDDLVDVILHSITQANAGESFKAIEEHINNSIAIALVGQANTVEIPKKSGSRAALEVQERISADIMWEDLSNAEAACNSLLEKDYFQYYDRTKKPPYRIVFLTQEGEDSEANAIVIREALAAQIPLIKTEVYSKINFTPPSEGDEVFLPQPALV